EGVGVDLAAAEAPLHLGDRDRTDLLLIDDDVPDRLVAALGATVGAVVVDARLLLIEAGRRRLLGARRRPPRARAADHDDVAALLAADLEDLAFDLVVGNRVLRRAGVADDLHVAFPREMARNPAGALAALEPSTPAAPPLLGEKIVSGSIEKSQ